MSLRTERLASLLKRDIGPILQKYQNGSIITITSIRVTDDLLTAKVYLSIYSVSGDTHSVYNFLKEKTSDIRTELAALIRNQVRRIPELVFLMDDTAEYVNKMEALFKKIRQDK